MGENKKFNSEEIDLENLIDEVTTGRIPKNLQDSSQKFSLEEKEDSLVVINAESIENSKIISLQNTSEQQPPIENKNIQEEEPVSLVEEEPVKEEPILLVEEEPVKEEPILLVEEKIEKEGTGSIEFKTTLSAPFEELANQALSKVTTTPLNTNSSLQTAEYLSIAQNKIIELQSLIENLHEENSNITAAGELWKQRFGNSEKTLVDLKNKHDNMKSSQKTDQKIFTITVDKQNKKIESLEQNLGEAELLTEKKLSTYKLIASDLENRIEIIDREKLTLLDGKNKFISDLQKQINTLQKINTNDKKKLQQVSNLINEKEQTLRNTIKLLRQTLISLEIGDLDDSELSLVS